MWSHVESVTVMFGVAVLQKYASMYFEMSWGFGLNSLGKY